MPRGKIALSEKQKRDKRVSKNVDALENYIRWSMRKAHVTQSQCAAALGMTQSGFSQALSKMTLRPDQIYTVLDLAGATITLGE